MHSTTLSLLLYTVDKLFLLEYSLYHIISVTVHSWQDYIYYSMHSTTLFLIQNAFYFEIFFKLF